MGPDDVVVLDVVGTTRLADLIELFQGAWWAGGRSAAEVTRMLDSSDLVVALVDRRSDRLVGFCRVLTDFTFLALILDVVVSPERRGLGLGARLMDTVVAHPLLADVASLELVCQPDLLPFYHQWGFTDQVGAARLMRRTPRGSAR
jgi:GNAT superfamily N-acetyltransferase